MLITLDEVKAYLGVTGNEYDSFLTELILILSETIETYCARKFLSAEYVQTVERGDFKGDSFYLYHYPVSAITELLIDGVPTPDYRLHSASGLLQIRGLFCFTEMKVTFNGGFATLPQPIRYAMLSVIQEKYTRKTAGIDLSFGSDVQRISIPSVISVDFDYSLQSNENKNAFGMVLGNYTNLVAPYKSERTMVGSAMVAYVE